MKKFLLWIVCALTATALTACAAEQEIPEASANPTTQANTAATTPASAAQSQFSELLVADNETCIIKITGIEPDSFWGYTLNCYLENKSPDTTYMVAVSTAAINGVQADPFFATEIAPGKKAKEKISFNPDSLGAIGQYTHIELQFRVYDANDLAAEPVTIPTAHIYPLGQENAQPFSRESQPGDVTLVENENLSVVLTGIRQDSIWGYTADVFLVNPSDQDLMVAVDEASVNGFMADPFFAMELSAGKCAFASISWSDSTLEENGITQVESIEFVLRAYSVKDWSAGDLVNESVVIRAAS